MQCESFIWTLLRSLRVTFAEWFRVIRRLAVFFFEYKGFGLGSQYTLGRLFSVYACVDVCSRTRKAQAMSICLFGMFVMTERIREFVAAFGLCSCAVYTIRIALHVTLLVPLHVSARGITRF
jgi:hypothetical protein